MISFAFVASFAPAVGPPPVHRTERNRRQGHARRRAGAPGAQVDGEVRRQPGGGRKGGEPLDWLLGLSGLTKLTWNDMESHLCKT